MNTAIIKYFCGTDRSVAFNNNKNSVLLCKNYKMPKNKKNYKIKNLTLKLT